jgi:hypothetical protein
MTLEERIEKEEENNRRLAFEIARQTAEEKRLWEFGWNRRPPHWGGGAPSSKNTHPVNFFEPFRVSEPVRELERLKSESDKRLAVLKREMQKYARAGETQDPTASDFWHSDDYRQVKLRGQEFYLTSRQAQIIEYLHKAHQKGEPEVSTHHLMSDIGIESSRLRDSFRSRPVERKALLLSTRRGFVRLNL